MDKREKGLALLDLNDLRKNGFAGLPIEVIILHTHGKIFRKLVGSMYQLGTICTLIFLLVFSEILAKYIKLKLPTLQLIDEGFNHDFTPLYEKC